MDTALDFMIEPHTRPARVSNCVRDPLVGIRLDALTWPLERVKEGSREKPFVRNPAERFAARFPKYVENYKNPPDMLSAWWQSAWYSIPYKALSAVFTPDELSRLDWDATIQSGVYEYLYRGDSRYTDEHTDPPAFVLWKIRNAMWRWGWVNDYNVFVDAYEGIRRLTFHEGFEVRLDHTRGCNERGLAQHLLHARDWKSTEEPVYLDSAFGLLVYYKGVHVLTIGFTPSCHGILLAQVQMRKKKGNRWMWKVSKNYLEHVIDRFHEAFPSTPICLVDGASAVAAIRSFYGDRKAEFDAKGAAPRIQAFYDQPLEGYTRGKVVEGDRVLFHTLTKKVS